MSGYATKAWRQARATALISARHRCAQCRARDDLVVHHLDGLGMRGPHAVDQRNLQVLCRSCHGIAHPNVYTP